MNTHFLDPCSLPLPSQINSMRADWARKLSSEDQLVPAGLEAGLIGLELSTERTK